MASGIPNGKEFKAGLRVDLIDATRQDVIDVQTILALDLTDALIRNTPRDQGILVGNWQAGIGSAPEDEKTTPDPDGSAAQAQIASAIATLNPEAPFVPCFVTNPSPYAEVVDQGGFVPPNPSEDEASRKKRAASRSKPKREEAAAKLGHEGATYVRGGYSIKAPAGMVDVAFNEITIKHGLEEA